MLYQYIKDNIVSIIESTEKYLYLKDLYINVILPSCENYSLNVIKRICYSVSIIFGIGSLNIFSNLIEEIINYGKKSVEKCYISIIILNSIFFELEKLEIKDDKKILTKIIDNLRESYLLVIDYINFLLENFSFDEQSSNNLENTKSFITKQEIKSEILELINSWYKLNINILFIPKIFQVLLKSVNPTNSEKISFIFSDSISITESAKFYEKNQMYELKMLLKEIKLEDYQVMEALINFINVYLTNKIKKENQNCLTTDEIEILSNLGFIFSTILENYIYFFFLNNNLSKIVYEIFFFFLSSNNLRISSKMFKIIDELSVFINEADFILDYKEEEKNELINFLISIISKIIFNCKFCKIVIPFLESGRIIKKFYEIELEDEKDLHIIDSKHMTTSEYRKLSQEVYFDIFLIFKNNFENNGVNYFFSYLNSIINQNALNEKNTSLGIMNQDTQKIYLIEVIIHLINSIILCMDYTDPNTDILIELSLKIFDSEIINNEFILCSFMIFLNNFSNYIPRNKILYSKSLELFLYSLKNKQFEFISTDTLLQITEFQDFPNVDSFNYIYNIYLENFDNFKTESLQNLTETLINSVAIKINENFCEKKFTAKEFNSDDTQFIYENKRNLKKNFIHFSDEEVLNFFKLILNTLISKLEKISEFLKMDINKEIFDKNLTKELKNSLIKYFSIYSVIVMKSENSIFIFQNILNQFYENCYFLLENAITLFTQDTKFIISLLSIFDNILSLSFSFINKELKNEFFKKFNDLFIYTYINNNENFMCINHMIHLYKNYKFLEISYKEYINSNFLIFSNKVFLNLKNSEKLNYSMLSNYTQLWIYILQNIDYLFFDEIIFNDYIDLILNNLFNNSHFHLTEISLEFLISFLKLHNLFSESIIFKVIQKTLIKISNSFSIIDQVEKVKKIFNIKISRLIIQIIDINSDFFSNILIGIFLNDQVLCKIPLEKIETILKYFILMSKSEIKIGTLISDLIKFSKSEINSNFVIFYENELFRIKNLD